MFLTLEGTEGSGKSTAATWIKEWLVTRGIDVVTTREPGGTGLGERIRSLLLDGASAPSPTASLLMFEAARAQLVSDIIRPALQRGATVLSDRFADSTLAYQGFGEGVPLAVIRQLNDIATGGLCPDLTILLDVDPEIGLERRGGAGDLNAMDRRGLAFHRRVREGFLVLAAEDPHRWTVVRADQRLPEVRAGIVSQLEALYAGAATVA